MADKPAKSPYLEISVDQQNNIFFEFIIRITFKLQEGHVDPDR